MVKPCGSCYHERPANGGAAVNSLHRELHMRRFLSHFLALIGVMATLVACSPTSIVLRQPTTGQVAECTSAWPYAVSVFGDVQSCAETYRQRGYVQQTP